jgi:predicted RNase H-like HicB family nuclease
MEYIAFIHKEENDYIAVVPDLNYTSSFASTFYDIVHNIIEASELYCEDLKRLPKATSLDILEKEYQEENAMPHLINIKVEKNVRVNVMLNYDILAIANERAKTSYNGNRSAYIQSLIENENATAILA